MIKTKTFNNLEDLNKWRTTERIISIIEEHNTYILMTRLKIYYEEKSEGPKTVRLTSGEIVTLQAGTSNFPDLGNG